MPPLCLPHRHADTVISLEMSNRHHGNGRSQRAAVVDMTDIDIPSDELDLPAQETTEAIEDEEVEDDGEGDEDEEGQGPSYTIVA